MSERLGICDTSVIPDAPDPLIQSASGVVFAMAAIAVVASQRRQLQRIYLEPDCCGGPARDRMWCEDDQGPCDCGAEWLAYDLADHAELKARAAHSPASAPA